jgi:hypothetical protein
MSKTKQENDLREYRRCFRCAKSKDCKYKIQPKGSVIMFCPYFSKETSMENSNEKTN